MLLRTPMNQAHSAHQKLHSHYHAQTTPPGVHTSAYFDMLKRSLLTGCRMKATASHCLAAFQTVWGPCHAVRYCQHTGHCMIPAMLWFIPHYRIQTSFLRRASESPAGALGSTPPGSRISQDHDFFASSRLVGGSQAVSSESSDLLGSVQWTVELIMLICFTRLLGTRYEIMYLSPMSTRIPQEARTPRGILGLRR